MQEIITRKQIEAAEKAKWRIGLQTYKYQKFGGKKPMNTTKSLVYTNAVSIVNKVSLALKRLHHVYDSHFPSTWIAKDKTLLLITEGCWFKVVIEEDSYENNTLSDDYYWQIHDPTRELKNK